ncbi:type 1 glutamine amidotransferase [Halopelagius longus]|uniref:GMP synthase (Glutamine-hydrolysing) n=1 Tax=Halopelagius longus TaxID=1236180 RepID=A0A1H0Y1L7_9EURY|nr:type 1 glutamine amidotransferase [Halopelagius longus]RDI72224.1 type 1 glutamine amidotransferase [Halopelagius longus]SDQ09000.1 GMP synthase (glutamine-hydrolysing) [Halopelagius longus]
MSSPPIAVVRNEVHSEYEYHCDALSGNFPDAREVEFPAGERPDLDRVAGLVLTGSTAGVYERDDRPWIDDERRLVEAAVEREIPTLGVCFGHQLVNRALGGTVENVGTTARLVEAEFADDPLFEGVSPVVPVAHADVVTDTGDEMEVIASADYYRAFGTRHRDAPLWTVQFHPEFTPELRGRLANDFGWDESGLRFEDANGARLFENFRSIVEASADS